MATKMTSPQPPSQLTTPTASPNPTSPTSQSRNSVSPANFGSKRGSASLEEVSVGIESETSSCYHTETETEPETELEDFPTFQNLHLVESDSDSRSCADKTITIVKATNGNVRKYVSNNSNSKSSRSLSTTTITSSTHASNDSSSSSSSSKSKSAKKYAIGGVASSDSNTVSVSKNSSKSKSAQMSDVVDKSQDMTSLDGEVRWRLLGEVEALKRSKCRRLYAQRGRPADLALFYKQGKFYCMAAWCSHMGGPLFEGDIEDYKGTLHVMCPWHAYMFDVITGMSDIGLQQDVFEVKIKDGQVFVLYGTDLSLNPYLSL